jgi:hypothetical protein
MTIHEPKLSVNPEAEENDRTHDGIILGWAKRLGIVGIDALVAVVKGDDRYKTKPHIRLEESINWHIRKLRGKGLLQEA